MENKKADKEKSHKGIWWWENVLNDVVVGNAPGASRG